MQVPFFPLFVFFFVLRSSPSVEAVPARWQHTLQGTDREERRYRCEWLACSRTRCPMFLRTVTSRTCRVRFEKKTVVFLICNAFITLLSAYPSEEKSRIRHQTPELSPRSLFHLSVSPLPPHSQHMSLLCFEFDGLGVFLYGLCV